MPIRPIDPAKRKAVAAPSPSTTIEEVEATTKFVPKTAAEVLAEGKPPRIRRRVLADTDPIIVPEPKKRVRHKTDRTGPNRDENGDYLVGKNRPPVAHQWKPGQSGNPRGPKPKEKLTPLQRFEATILKEFPVRQNGKEVMVNLGDFAIGTLKAAATRGTSVKASKDLLDLFHSVIRRQAEVSDTPAMAEWEQQMIDALADELNLPRAPVVRRAREIPSDELFDDEGDEL